MPSMSGCERAFPTSFWRIALVVGGGPISARCAASATPGSPTGRSPRDPSALGASWNPQVLARVRHMVQLYKGFVRPFMSQGRIYHHTPAFEGPEPQGWGVLELASRDRSRAIAGLFQLSAPRRSEYLLRLRGLDVSRRYRVTWDNTGHSCELDGLALMHQGLPVRLEGALTSELLLCEAV